MTDHADTPGTRDNKTSSRDLHKVVEDVVESHGDQGADVMAEQLRDRVAETQAKEEDAGDRQN